HQELRIETLKSARVNGENSSTILISGPLQELAAFEKTLEHTKDDSFEGEVIVDSMKFDIRITDSTIPDLVHRVAAVFKEFGINMVHLEYAGGREQLARMFIRIEVLTSKVSSDLDQVKQRLDALGEEVTV